MTRANSVFVWRRVAVIAGTGLVAALLSALVLPRSTAATLCLLGAGIAVGELLVIRSDDSVGLPLSYALFPVLASSFDWRASVATLVVSMAAVYGLRVDGDQLRRTAISVMHVVVGLVAIVAFRLGFAAFGAREQLGIVLVALLATVLAMITSDEVQRVRMKFGSGLDDRGRRAWLAVCSSGILMAVGERGVDGIGHLGVWGPILFAIPLVAAWYSFERLDAARRTHQQTIEALAMAPEFAGLVGTGHAQRVADIAAAVARQLGMQDDAVDRLATAARLHHLGAVTLDDPAYGAPVPPATTVAHVTADMLRGIESLAAAGDIVARAGSRRSFTFLDARGNTSAMILQHANAYDEFVNERHIDHVRALTRIREGAAGCDEVERSVIDALEDVVGRRRDAVLSR